MIIGLTGGMGTGKSTVLSMFRKSGCGTLSADELARKVMEPQGAVFGRVVKKFGKGILKRNGTLDRKKLASIIFARADRKRLLERLTHPAIIRLLKKEIADRRKRKGIFVVDVPLLFEADLGCLFDRIILVYASRRVQYLRLARREHLSPDEIQRRTGAQMSLSAKKKKSDYLLPNDGSKKDLERRVRKIKKSLDRIKGL